MRNAFTVALAVLLVCSFVYASKEVVLYDQPGQQRSCVIVDANGSVWNTEANSFSVVTTDANKAYNLGESTNLKGRYEVNFPADIVDKGVYDVAFYDTNTARFDSNNTMVGGDAIYWTGSRQYTLFDVADQNAINLIATLPTKTDLSATDNNVILAIARNDVNRVASDAAIATKIDDSNSNIIAALGDIDVTVDGDFNSVRLASDGMKNLSMADPNGEPNNWTGQDWFVFQNKIRWGNKTILNKSTDYFEICDSNGNVLIQQYAPTVGNLDYIYRVESP